MAAWEQNCIPPDVELQSTPVVNGAVVLHIISERGKTRAEDALVLSDRRCFAINAIADGHVGVVTESPRRVRPPWMPQDCLPKHRSVAIKDDADFLLN